MAMGVIANTDSESEETIKILLIGDSTTDGGKPVFEDSMEQLFAGEDSVPPVEVINVGMGGETAYSLLNSGRYVRDIKNIDNVDYIFVRYGINDWIHREPFEENFPADMKNVISNLKQDFPDAEIILTNIIPFLWSESYTETVNAHIEQIASDENLDVFDLYTPYKAKMDEFGRNALTVRFFALSEIPQNYHKLVAPFTKYYAWKGAEWLMVQTNEFDPILGHLPNWYQDSHPNTTGYRLIADETVKYLTPKIKEKLISDATSINTTLQEVAVEMNLYPNPTNSHLTINSSEIINKLEIFDNVGQLMNINYPKVNETNINLENYTEGVYYFNIHTAIGRVNRKVVITN